MKNTKEVEAAALDFFEKCMPGERVEAFVFMASKISARDKRHLSFAPNEGIGTDDLIRLFRDCNLPEKLQVVFFIVGLWTDRVAASLKPINPDPITAHEKELVKKAQAVILADQAAAPGIDSHTIIIPDHLKGEKPVLETLGSVIEKTKELAGVTAETAADQAAAPGIDPHQIIIPEYIYEP